MKPAFMRSRQRGLSLIEVLVSLVIGLVVVGAVLVSLLGAGQAGKFQGAYSQMNEDVQIALSILSRDIQMAGYSTPTGLIPDPADATRSILAFATVPVTGFIIGCDTGFATPGTSNTCGTATTSAFEVAYEADNFNTVPASGVPSNCLGNAIAVGPPYVARNRFFISTGPAGRPELSCGSVGTAGGTSQPLVENIENMKIWYGTTLATAPTQVVRYVTATDIASLGVGASAEWDRVVAVRICLLVRSADPVLNPGDGDTLTYLDCDSVQQTSNDRYLRRAYFSTATLRDKMP
jgi:type IV pilus assembly protein PilW